MNKNKYEAMKQNCKKVVTFECLKYRISYGVTTQLVERDISCEF